MGNAVYSPGIVYTTSVHPHVHGERPVAMVNAPNLTGSSPRTWGTQKNAHRSLLVIRFIPTYMGNAATSCRTPGIRPVHPHVHGERVPFRWQSSRNVGSSPRTWGTQKPVIIVLSYVRFIPTYMGNAHGSPRKLVRFPVHPHVHGERLPDGEAHNKYHGSSPRTWGTPRTPIPSPPS